MNPVVEEMNDILMHYGMPRRSGRYPWGSGDDPYQHSRDFISRVEELKKNGWTETPENIKKEFGLTTKQYRTEKRLANHERRMLQVATAKSLEKDGLGPTEIGKKMGVNESTVRSWLNPKSEARMNQAKNIAKDIKAEIDKKGMIDIGKGVERELNISREQLDEALYILEREGYPIYNGRFEQNTNAGKFITQKVICPPGTEYKEIYNLENVHSLKEYISRDGGNSLEKKFHYPASMDSSRLMIRYKEDGGIDKDGIVELRRGVDDLSLGESRYSQVRILVDGTKYIKGMAVYSDDMPDGVDVIFNTNKSKDVPKMDVLKDIKKDDDNPFGSLIKDVEQGGQYWYTDKKTGERKLGLINKRADEGDWDDWADALPSQFLGKQSLSLAKKQLDLAKADKYAEYDEICSLTNPTIKKHLLEEFANNCDSAAVHLKAAALPGQKYHVIIPVGTLTDKEVYAPGYEPGTKLALVRYPHGGTFEIPILTVTHKNAVAKRLIGTTPIDAVCINSKVAERLSGADFDGDTVMCIPTHDKHGRVKITSTKELEGLKGFDPKMAYPEREGMKYLSKKATQIEMGKISNLITDMTIAGANNDEIAAAVRHSMVVIDANKHKLDYKQSELDNNIAALKKNYQGYIDKDGKLRYGASTILSRAKGQEDVIKRQGTPKINIKGTPDYDPNRPEGALIYKQAEDAAYTKTKTNKRTGVTTTETRYRTEKSTQMAETDDAYTLVSEGRHPMELRYADYANSMKALANQARKEMVSTGKIQYDKNAKSVYQKEVSSLMSKLNTALLNSTREREAQRRANVIVERKKQNNPDMTKEDIKKEKQRALSSSRKEVGSISRRDRNIDITDREWEAIQAGAISENKLKQILDNTDVDVLRQRATPRATTTFSTAKVNRIKRLAASNYTIDEIARKLGCSTSTVSQYLKGVNA